MSTVATASDILTVAQAAKALGLTPHRVREFCREGRLGFRAGNTWLVGASDLEKFRRKARPTGRPPSDSEQNLKN